ncbi:MAG: hypothetical protein EBU52_07410 [Cytophagia bacterium]|nr:hypothetical protein [Cytophagia bacterium]
MIIVGLFFLAGTAFAQQSAIQYWRPYDQRGINVFETSKNDTVVFEGLKVRFGAGFTQGYQSIEHSNSARATFGTYLETAPGSGVFTLANGNPLPVGTTIAKNPAVAGGYAVTQGANTTQFADVNSFYAMAGGFPLAQANLNIDVQLADGISLNLVSYMSSHHHNEFWVKGGYLKIDKVSFLNSALFDRLWKNLTLKVGHMEVNYGDAHFRRSDGGHTIWNPWVENNIMDEFTTEIGAELYWKKNGVIAMLGFTDGEIKGDVSDPSAPDGAKRKPSLYGKLGFDKQVTDNFRARLTGSFYTTKSSTSNTIFGGDRTGSNYQYVMENGPVKLTDNAFSGRFNPGFKDNVTTIMINPFVKLSGLEVFGTLEWASGNSQFENGEGVTGYSAEGDRDASQIAAEALYRFGKNEKFYVGARYITVSATIAEGYTATVQGTRYDVDINRTSIGAGWFITRNILLKGEYVTQKYEGFKDTGANNRFYGGEFDGIVIQGAISF